MPFPIAILAVLMLCMPVAAQERAKTEPVQGSSFVYTVPKPAEGENFGYFVPASRWPSEPGPE